MMYSSKLRRTALSLAATACLTAVAACAQEPGAAPRTTATASVADSVTARAQRGRLKGAENAPAMLVEVSDFQCPFCRQFAQTTYAKLDSAYIRTGRVRMLFINFPLPNHRNGFAASEAAMCAGAQDRFWQMHDRLFLAQETWSPSAATEELFEGYAEQLGLDVAAFRDCTANDRTASLIVSDVMEATSAGITGTPAFLLSGPGGRKPLAGAVTWEVLQAEIESVLAPAPAGQSAPPTPPQN